MDNLVKMPQYEINIIKKDIGKINFNLSLYDIPSQWRITKGEGIKIGVLDSGLPRHKDLKGKIIASKNFTNDASEDDADGHACGVCGIIAAESESQNGITGIAPKSQLLVGKVLNDAGSGSDTFLANGIRWCVDNGCHIINMSVGAPANTEKRFTKTREAVNYAYSKNVFMFGAAGNDGSQQIDLPAKWNKVFCIVAIDKEKQVPYFSNSGNEVDFSCLGVDVISTYLNETYASMSGTSFACPAASAIAALILSEHYSGKEMNTPIKDYWDMRAHLIRISTSLGTAPWNPKYGFGNIVFGKPDNPVDPYNRVYGGIPEEKLVNKSWWEKLLFWR